MKNLDQLIERNKQIGILLQELKTMIEVEKYNFCIRKVDKFNWELIKVSTRELVKVDHLDRIQSHLRLRNITSVITI